jgi:Zn-dependent protease with chaperone function
MNDPIKCSIYAGLFFLIFTMIYLLISKPNFITYLDKDGIRKIDISLLLVTSILIQITVSIIAFFILTSNRVVEYSEKSVSQNFL